MFAGENGGGRTRKTKPKNESKIKMKTTINGKLTRAGIKFVAGITPRRHTLPILSNVRLYANGSFEVTGTDLDCTLQARLPGTTEIEGKTTLPAKALCDAIAGGSDIILETNDKNITKIQMGAAVRSIHGLSADEFPAEMLPGANAQSVIIPAGEFIAALKSVALAISKGWIRNAKEAVEELQDDKAAKYFNGNQQITAGSPFLMLTE
jgi:DNA polymerase III sliding clamp (beta) subunit (PCNA family)